MDHDATPESTSALWPIVEFRRAALAAVSSTERSKGPAPVEVEAPTQLAPLPLNDALDALQEGGEKLVTEALSLRAGVADLGNACVGIALGDLLRTGHFQATPELTHRVAETAADLEKVLARVVQLARLLRHYHSLPQFVNGIADVFASPDCSDATTITDPELHAKLNLPPLAEPYEKLAESIGSTIRQHRRPNEGVMVGLPAALRPREYAEGMKSVCESCDQLRGAAADLIPSMEQLCLLVFRGDLADGEMTTSVAPQLAETSHVIGAMLTAVFEDLCQCAALTRTQPAIEAIAGNLELPTAENTRPSK